MELQATFLYRGWQIRYALLEPKSTTARDVKTVVFAHGTPWSSATFVPLAKALSAQNCRILLYDLPGYGQSQSYQRQAGERAGALFDGDTSVKFQGEALSELLHLLQLDGKNGHEAPSVIAHDIAGAIVLRAHLLLDCQFRSLLLMDTNAVLPWGDGFYKLVRSSPELFLELPPHTFEAVLRATIRSACHNPAKLKAEWEDLLAAPWLADSEDLQAARQKSFVRQIAQASDADVAEMQDQDLYSKVQFPVKIFWGEDDKWIPREKMEQLAEMLGDRLKDFVVIPQAGHLIMVEQPERVSIEVFSWLSKQGCIDI